MGCFTLGGFFQLDVEVPPCNPPSGFIWLNVKVHLLVTKWILSAECRSSTFFGHRVDFSNCKHDFHLVATKWDFSTRCGSSTRWTSSEFSFMCMCYGLGLVFSIRNFSPRCYCENKLKIWHYGLLFLWCKTNCIAICALLKHKFATTECSQN
jgi:hypothetical protein